MPKKSLIAVVLVVFTGWIAVHFSTTKPVPVEGLDDQTPSTRVSDSVHTETPLESTTTTHNHVQESWVGQFSPTLQEAGEQYSSEKKPARFVTMPMNRGDPLVIRIQHHVAVSPAEGTLTGEVDGHPGSFVSLAYVNGREAGTVQIPALGLVYEVRASLDGETLFNKVNINAMGECGLCQSDALVEYFPQPAPH